MSKIKEILGHLKDYSMTIIQIIVQIWKESGWIDRILFFWLMSIFVTILFLIFMMFDITKTIFSKTFKT